MNHTATELKIKPSVCALDCPDACALHITVDGSRVVDLTGSPDHPITQGFACVKTVRYPERQEHADRLLYPMKRVGKKGEGKFERIDWDSALDDVATRLVEIAKASGSETILPYCYSGTLGIRESKQPLAFFRALGAAELDQTICATTGGAGWEAAYGPNKLGTDPETITCADVILLWGINVLRSNSHLTPFLKQARKEGAKIVHIDPYRNETSKFSTKHLQIRVGSDAALALAIANLLFEQNLIDEAYLAEHASGVAAFREAAREWTAEKAAAFCGIPADEIVEVANAYGQAKCSYIRLGYGMSRNEGGGNAVHAIALLPALTGAWTIHGGGACLSTSGAFGLNDSEISGKHLVLPETRVVNMNLLASELNREDAQRIQSLIVFNSNPAVVAPNSRGIRQGLKREDLFTVVLEHFQTDTADHADYLLPATTFLEHCDVYTAYGHYYLQWAEPVVEARGEARPNSWIFSELAKRMQADIPRMRQPCVHWNATEVAERLLDSENPRLQGISFEELQKRRSIKLSLGQPFLPYVNGSHHADRKVHFEPVPKQLEFEERITDQFPLRLISPPGAYVLNSTFGNVESLLKMAGGEPQILVHPKDAEMAGIGNGTRATIVSRYGNIERKVVVTEDARCGVAIAVGQWWSKLAPDKKSLNDLISERLTDLGGGSTFGNVAVRLEPANSGRT